MTKATEILSLFEKEDIPTRVDKLFSKCLGGRIKGKSKREVSMMNVYDSIVLPALEKVCPYDEIEVGEYSIYDCVKKLSPKDQKDLERKLDKAAKFFGFEW